MSEVFFEALQDYLRGEEWRQSIEMFVEANCANFRCVKEFDHRHHALWKTFQEIVDQILDMALSNVGGSLTMLEEAFDQLSSQRSRGPRDETIKEVLAKLLTYQSFEDFAGMMKLAAASLPDIEPKKEHSNGHQFIDTLVAMGFPADLVEDVVDGHHGYVTLEQLVMQLSEMQFAVQAVASPQTHRSYPPKDKLYDRQHNCESSPTATPHKSVSHLDKFASYCRSSAEIDQKIDASDLNAKFVMASSVFETFDPSQSNDESNDLLRWATAMGELLDSIKSAFLEDIDFDSVQRGGQSLAAWFVQLEQLRRSIDEDSVIGSMISDKEMERMAELDRIAALGTQDEQLLHRLIVRHDELRRDTSGCYRKISDISRLGGSVDRERLEELYLYLKEQIASGVDLEAVGDEMHERVYSVVSSAKGAEVVNVLLELHILEDEQSMVRARINAMLQMSPTQTKSLPGNLELMASADSVSFPADSKSESNNYRAADAEGNDWSFGGSSQSGELESFCGNPNPNPNRCENKCEDESTYRHSQVAESKSGSSGTMSGDKSVDYKNDGYRQSRGVKSTLDNNTVTNNTEYLDELKTKHKTSLEKLKNSLEAEKSRRLQDIEDRLARRRLMHKRELVANPAMSVEDRLILDEDLKTAEDTASLEIKNVHTAIDKLKEGIISGFKKRSINELKAAKANGGEPLSIEDQRQCYKDTAEALKKRHERDQKSLLDSLAAERSRQKTKILQRLENNKKKVTATGNSISHQQLEQLQYLTEQADEALRRMDLEFDQQQMASLRDSQREALLALSVINMDGSLLEETTTTNAQDASEDDDLYMEEMVDSHKPLTAWLQCVENVNDAYLAAEDGLFRKMRNALAQESGDETENDSNDEGFNMISSHMSKVMTEAFCEHISEFDARELAKRKTVEVKVDEDRIRAGIMNEFEKARDEYENALDMAKLRSKASLDKRRSKESARSDLKDAAATEPLSRVSAHFEDVIDSFLDDPISSVSSISPLRKSKSKLTSLNSQPKLNAIVSNRLSSSVLPTSPGIALNSTLSAEVALSANGGQIVQLSENGVGVGGRIVGGSDSAILLDKDRIRAAHAEKEKALIDELQGQMRNKKLQLEERLKRKKDSRMRGEAKEVDGNADGLHDDEERMQQDMKSLDSAFDYIRDLIKSAVTTSSLDKVNATNLMDLMERVSKGEKIASLDQLNGIVSLTVDRGALPALSANELKADDGESWEFGTPGADDGEEYLTKRTIDKESMQEKVKKISSEYNEEKQKLDLMMKIQQARQRQILQRKLMERKQQTGFTIPEAAINATKVNTGIASRGMNLGPMMRK